MRAKGMRKRMGKVEMKRIHNSIRRQITLSKRKAGLFKKTAELSLLCDVDVALIISTPSGKLYHSPAPNIDRTLRKYQKNYASSDYYAGGAQDSENIELLQVELEKGRKIEFEFERMQRYMNGEDLECLSFKELQQLEQRITIGATKIRKRKERFQRKHISALKSKLKKRKVGTDQNDLEGGSANVRADDHQQPHQRDGDANGVARSQTNFQYNTNLLLSLF